MNPKVFISYSSVDEELAWQVKKALDEINVGCFFDRKDVKWGDKFPDRITEGLADCSALIVIISPASLKSQWVPFEIGHATGLGKTILPFLTHPSLEVPAYLQNFHYLTRLPDVKKYLTITVNDVNNKNQRNSIQTKQDGSASIVLNLSEELQNKNLTFGLLHVRDGKDQISDKGPLLNREIVFREIDRHGTLVANVTYARQIGFQFKCFVDYKGTAFDEVKDLLSSNGYERISKGGGKPFRAWFLLADYRTCLTIDGFTNNFYYPA